MIIIIYRLSPFDKIQKKFQKIPKKFQKISKNSKKISKNFKKIIILSLLTITLYCQSTFYFEKNYIKL